MDEVEMRRLVSVLLDQLHQVVLNLEDGKSVIAYRVTGDMAASHVMLKEALDRRNP